MNIDERGFVNYDIVRMLRGHQRITLNYEDGEKSFFYNVQITHEAADEIERLRSCIADLIAAGDVLAKEIEIGGRCACRREWVCHKCEAVEAWRSVRGR